MYPSVVGSGGGGGSGGAWRGGGGGRTGRGDGDKGKGKGKGRPKTPAELGFALSAGGRLWERQAVLVGGAAVGDATDCLETGNLDEKKAAGKGLGRLSPGRAEIEILCNRQSILGNPFTLGKKVKLESLRGPVLDAYEDYLEAVLAGADAVDISGVARKHGLSTEENLAKDWREIYDAAHGPEGVRRSIAELRERLQKTRLAGAGGVRLLCHCEPLPCHTRLLAQRLRASASVSGAVDGRAGSREPEKGGGGGATGSSGGVRVALDGRWVDRHRRSDGVVAEIGKGGTALRWPSGKESSLERVHTDDGIEIHLKLEGGAELRGRIGPGGRELLWDDGDVWSKLDEGSAAVGDCIDDLSNRFTTSLRVGGRDNGSDRAVGGSGACAEGKAGVSAGRRRWGRGEAGGIDTIPAPAAATRGSRPGADDHRADPGGWDVAWNWGETEWRSGGAGCGSGDGGGSGRWSHSGGAKGSDWSQDRGGSQWKGGGGSGGW